MDKILINGLTSKGKIFFQVFLRFLKEYNYFYNYRKAFENYKRDNKIGNLKFCCNNLSPRIVDQTLWWDETAEGFDYWQHVNAQFKELCANILK